ncbi:tRNA lysidine(34) synthetase TilS [Corynebacterium sp. sy039]|uniref:tRNA lysidine(34) synthetase TilS n=1 Tax=Corynebacterium sp. sy039 TaxID=2599641 RepID=UPI0011B5A25A|nr:tRNA lysidine(34) synthetase TilS [Corynebacterium sp. sy039]QDZ41973.1 tRNA lysidine(34) synthetase TilS [Corynebacterium sp. sy039]
MVTPFWPRKSPHFLRLRRAVRAVAGDPVIGLSGGADSLALVAAAIAENRCVHAVIIDHALQPGSAEIARRSAERAAHLGATTQIITVTVPQGNIEAMARKVRYAALHEIARQYGRALWVGHTMDDQAETFLLSALRGHATGMVIDKENENLKRPFLQVRRQDTRMACQELGLEYWDDPMNDDTRFLRVALRTEILPHIAQYTHSDPVIAFAQAAENIAAQQHYIDSAAGAADGLKSLAIAELAALDQAVRRQRIIAFLHEHETKVTAAATTAIEQLIINWHGQGGVAVGGNKQYRLEVVRKNGKLLIEQKFNGTKSQQ